MSFFLESLAAKLAWRLISTDSLWSTVTKIKYIAPATVMEWVRNPVKSSKNASVVWKAVVSLAHTIEQGLAWKVGDGTRVRVGCDPWAGCSDRYALSHDLKLFLNERGYLFLNQVPNLRTTTIWRQGWLTEVDLHLEERWREEWSLFVLDLQNSSVQISETRDELVWVHARIGSYSPKTGYKWLMSQQGWEDPAWWSKLLWKLKCPGKTRLFFWCILQKKVPTWDFLQKRGK